jgi:hypothetical protein
MEAAMMAKQEKETRENRQLLQEIVEEYIQLSARDRFQVRLFIKWLKLRRPLRKMVWSWLIFQWKLDEEIKALIKKRR